MTAAVRPVHCATALVDGVAVDDVRLGVGPDGRITAVEPGVPAAPGDLRLGTVLVGSGNAHSHAFHRVLRGRTHGDGGDFWQWRTAMYRAAGALDPDSYRALAVGVFGEMLAAGWTAVGEFHYVHHRPDGTPHDDPNAIGLALADAARDVGIRLTLLDTCYLTGAPGEPLAPEQRRFGDGTAAAWLDRWHALRDAVGDDSLVTVGAAVHSVRAVRPHDVAVIAGALPDDVPLHVHLSEQPAENARSLAAWGARPTRVLADAGALSPRLSVVHATHLDDDEITLLGSAGVTAVICPTTEADLGDGIGPARRLADAGAVIALGSDQNAVVDPFLEVRGLEAGERLAARRRGVFSPAELDAARGTAGYRALGLRGGIAVGAWCDLVEVDPASVRTTGSAVPQLVLTATASDVQRVVVGGTVRAVDGRLADDRAPADLLTAWTEDHR
ncbi:formimidoylglutamate deiminase [Curtobacterium pusillum]|uniref:formimidoylglutamate deiminase n=1 Tax=Curtobacterium pusillum TaxID=69373 RepID=UPI0021B31A1F|nr:formimidoylglutamate deiminase [Curtobacterium pusillum]